MVLTSVPLLCPRRTNQHPGSRIQDLAKYCFAGAERFLDLIDLLRDGKAASIELEMSCAAVALLATRKIIDEGRTAELRKLITTAQFGARPHEVIETSEMDPRRHNVAETYVNWLNEWREAARVSISRRDYRIAFGLAQRRQSVDDVEILEPSESPTTAAQAQV